MKLFSIKLLSRINRLPRPEDGLRAVKQRAPQAEAFAATWIERFRPLGMRVHGLRHRIATVTVAVLAALLLVHVMFGANGMVVYRQKRAEYESLRKQIALEEKENDQYAEKIQSLQGDKEAIEKEAREQLGYAKPGEYVYVPPAPTKPAPAANHTARK